MFARMKTKPTASPATAPVVNSLLTSDALALLLVTGPSPLVALLGEEAAPYVRVMQTTIRYSSDSRPNCSTRRPFEGLYSASAVEAVRTRRFVDCYRNEERARLPKTVEFWAPKLMRPGRVKGRNSLLVWGPSVVGWGGP